MRWDAAHDVLIVKHFAEPVCAITPSSKQRFDRQQAVGHGEGGPHFARNASGIGSLYHAPVMVQACVGTQRVAIFQNFEKFGSGRESLTPDSPGQSEKLQNTRTSPCFAACEVSVKIYLSGHTNFMRFGCPLGLFSSYGQGSQGT